MLGSRQANEQLLVLLGCLHPPATLPPAAPLPCQSTPPASPYLQTQAAQPLVVRLLHMPQQLLPPHEG